MAVVRIVDESSGNAKTMVQFIVHFKFFLISFIFMQPLTGQNSHVRMVGDAEKS